ncbi:MAG TPA: membrane protein insertion efficiency factor YidD [Spirochaetota bacterium]|nr:membrane protein insertion efficiency factor YidD [Spirochaetota bacterium]HPI89552.1 membrane protein insertion efficiency factor YidD [Spirochaetota bacterium]HPR49016.1 membrane protein insertion efficiency factor YidD [Spirochaetota bacterium]
MKKVKNSIQYIHEATVTLLVLMIHGYQNLLRPMLPQSCRFYPSCSAYAIESLRTHGIVRGLILALYRILRCNPFNSGGYDPVPLNFSLFKQP